jgi:glycogen synthase
MGPPIVAKLATDKSRFAELRGAEVRLLLHSRFYPSVGGIETVADLLTQEWVKAGMEVTVVTDVAAPCDSGRRFPFPVIYRPSPRAFIELVRAHDVFVHFNISLKAIWPLIFVRRPFVAVHHGFYVTDERGRRDWRERSKLLIAKYATENIAVSEAIAKSIGIECKLVLNPFEASVYQTLEKQTRDRDLVFLGRLVSSKGAHILIEALARIRESQFKPTLTIIGDGPERAALETLVQEFQLADQVSFAGFIPTSEVAKTLQRHKVLIVPSIWNEGFGVVVLEGIATGCVVVGSDSGGLPEAIGQCGLVAQTGKPEALADAIERVLTDSDLVEKLKVNAPDHLNRHLPKRVAADYLAIISQLLSK